MRLIVLLICAVLLSSCAAVPVRNNSPIGPGGNFVSLPTAIPQGTGALFHVVAPGETLWRISKMYGASVSEIMRANNIESAQGLAVGARLYIPLPRAIRPVVPLYPSHKWHYIIVHHSATDSGNALSLNNIHNKRGFAGLGYHFVIDNGTYGKKNGQIEVAPRWIKQQDGAHCRANNMNSRGIGICLVGNFSREKVSSEQLASLVYLVNTLKRYYNIPYRNILGHRQVPGARTECPGNYFPWREFKRQIQ